MIQMMLPQRRRPTASARRQQEVAPVAKDDPVVPADIHAPSVEDDPVVAADVHAAGVDAANDAEGFPGEPRDPSVLIEYADHVAVSVWNEEVFIILKLTYFLSIYYYLNLSVGRVWIKKWQKSCRRK